MGPSGQQGIIGITGQAGLVGATGQSGNPSLPRNAVINSATSKRGPTGTVG